MTKPGGVSYYGWSNWRGDTLVDLKILLVGVTSNAKLQQAGIAMITILLFICYVRWFRRVGKRSGRDELFVLAGLTAICMLPVFHRMYDLALLTTALAWCLAEIDGPRRHRGSRAAGDDATADSEGHGQTNGYRVYHLYHLVAFWQNRVWPSFFVPLYAWELLAITIVLLLVMRKCAAESRRADDWDVVSLANLGPGCQTLGQRHSNG